MIRAAAGSRRDSVISCELESLDVVVVTGIFEFCLDLGGGEGGGLGSTKGSDGCWGRGWERTAAMVGVSRLNANQHHHPRPVLPRPALPFPPILAKRILSCDQFPDHATFTHYLKWFCPFNPVLLNFFFFFWVS